MECKAFGLLVELFDFVAFRVNHFLLFCCRYGFRTPPHLELKARPKLGEREVTLAHVTDWIEKKLDQEFQVLENSSFLVFVF